MRGGQLDGGRPTAQRAPQHRANASLLDANLAPLAADRGWQSLQIETSTPHRQERAPCGRAVGGRRAGA
jgi:hypothetical protein